MFANAYFKFSALKFTSSVCLFSIWKYFDKIHAIQSIYLSHTHIVDKVRITTKVISLTHMIHILVNMVFLIHVINKKTIIHYTRLPHTQGNSGTFDFFFKLQEVLIFSKNLRVVV